MQIDNTIILVLLSMWNYIKEDLPSDSRKKEYTSFPEPNGKREMPGFTFFENEDLGTKFISNCSDI